MFLDKKKKPKNVTEGDIAYEETTNIWRGESLGLHLLILNGEKDVWCLVMSLGFCFNL